MREEEPWKHKGRMKDGSSSSLADFSNRQLLHLGKFLNATGQQANPHFSI